VITTLEKHGNLREFVNSGKLREFKIYSGNLSDAVDCYMIVSLEHRVVCIIVSNNIVNWLGDIVTGDASQTLVVYRPTGSTAYEREMSTPPMLLRSMVLLYLLP